MPKKPSIARLITQFSRNEISQLFNHARSIYRNTHFDIRVAKAAQLVGRILIITPRKMGNAPQRNTIRRRLKALFYQEKWYEQPYDWIVYCKKKSDSLSFTEIKQMFLPIIASFAR